MNIIEMKFVRSVSLIGILLNIYPVLVGYENVSLPIWLIIMASILFIITFWITNKKIKHIKSCERVKFILDKLLDKMKEQEVTNLTDLKKNE